MSVCVSSIYYIMTGKIRQHFFLNCYDEKGHTIDIVMTHKTTRICKVQDPHLPFSLHCTYISYSTQQYSLKFINYFIFIFPQGIHSARLLYGVLEAGKRMSVS